MVHYEYLPPKPPREAPEPVPMRAALGAWFARFQFDSDDDAEHADGR